jgi:REP element-mobilizing transposase RayT
MMKIAEKKHRLPKPFYKGKISVAFTLCLKDSDVALNKPEIVDIFTDMLSRAARKASCMVPVYCYMPNHQHIIVSGIESDSDVLKTIVSYKQKTGYWMSKHKPETRWQKDYYDHVIRKDENLSTQVKYILDNPVRGGMVSSWRDYPYKGSIGCT